MCHNRRLNKQLFCNYVQAVVLPSYLHPPPPPTHSLHSVLYWEQLRYLFRHSFIEAINIFLSLSFHTHCTLSTLQETEDSALRNMKFLLCSFFFCFLGSGSLIILSPRSLCTASPLVFWPDWTSCSGWPTCGKSLDGRQCQLWSGLCKLCSVGAGCSCDSCLLSPDIVIQENTNSWCNVRPGEKSYPTKAQN